MSDSCSPIRMGDCGSRQGCGRQQICDNCENQRQECSVIQTCLPHREICEGRGETPTEPKINNVSVTAGRIEVGNEISVRWTTLNIDSTAIYKLERSINNGTYSEIYRGTAKEYKDKVLDGWLTVRYKVSTVNTSPIVTNTSIIKSISYTSIMYQQKKINKVLNMQKELKTNHKGIEW